MVTHIFHLEGGPRHYTYFAIFIALAGWPSLAFAYWSSCVLFYWDEFKIDFLDYDEFSEDCMELFDMDFDRNLEMATAWHTLVYDHYGKEGRSFPADMISQPSAYDRHADYEGGRLLSLFDHPEMYQVWAINEWLHEEWEDLAETEIEPTCQQSMEDLETFYYFYSEEKKIDFTFNNNQHKLFARDSVFYPLPTKTTASSFMLGVGDDLHYEDFFSYLTATKIDDLRRNYWIEKAAPVIKASK